MMHYICCFAYSKIEVHFIKSSLVFVKRKTITFLQNALKSHILNFPIPFSKSLNFGNLHEQTAKIISSSAHKFHMWYAFGPYFGDDFISSRQHKRNSNTLIQICILWKKSRSKWYSRCFTDNKIILIFDIFGTKIRNCNVSNNSLQYLAIKSQMFYRHKKILIFDIFWH